MASPSRLVRGDCNRASTQTASSSEVFPCAFAPTNTFIPGANSQASVSKHRKWRREIAVITSLVFSGFAVDVHAGTAAPASGSYHAFSISGTKWGMNEWIKFLISRPLIAENPTPMRRLYPAVPCLKSR
jgi:hypothetical protein